MVKAYHSEKAKKNPIWATELSAETKRFRTQIG